MSEIIEITDERGMQKKQKTKKKKKNKGDRSYSERVRDKWFCWAFKSGFLQLICKASLIFKSNLELLYERKERELFESKHDVVECRCLKIWHLAILFDMFLNLSFKMTTS